MEPSWHQNRTINRLNFKTKISKKTIPRGIQILIVLCFNFFRFLFRFGSQVGAMLATVLDPRRSQDAPRRLQDGHKMHQVVSKIPQDAPRRPKTPPRRPQDRVPDGPTSVFGRNYGYIFRNLRKLSRCFSFFHCLLDAFWGPSWFDFLP